jgi:hypothetical protein
VAGTLLVAFILPTAAQAGWSSTATVAGTGPDTTNTRIAGNPDSEALVVWTKPILGVSTVQAARLKADGTAGPVMNLSAAGKNAESPSVSVSPNGTAAVSWLWTNGVNDVVEAVSVSTAGTVGPVVDLSAVGPAGQDAAGPRTAIKDDGTMAVTWRKYNGALYSVQGRVVTSQGTPTTLQDFPALYGQNTDFPDISAANDGTFRLIWAEGTGALGNVGTSTLSADGSIPAIPVTYLFPSGPAEAPLGVTGEPSGAKVVSFQNGNAVYGWLRDIPTDPAVPASAIRSVEGAGLPSPLVPDTPVFPTTPVRVSPTTHAVSQFTLAVSPYISPQDGEEEGRGGNAALGGWTTEVPGNRQIEIRRMIPTGGLGGSRIVSGNVGTKGFPTVALSTQNWSTAAWYESTANPLVTTVKANRMSPTGLLPDPITNLNGSLSSASSPEVYAGAKGVPTVAFDGADGANLNSSFSRFTDPGTILISPSKVEFGSHNLNKKSRSRFVYLTSAGSTSNEIQSVGITGANASEFKVVGGSACIPEIAPGQTCSVGIAFRPTSKGSKKAQVAIQTETGTDIANLSGYGAARTSLGLKIKPKNRKVRRGKSFKVSTSISNLGGLQAKGLKLCFNARKRTFRPKQKCKTLSGLAVGKTRKVSVRIHLKNAAKKGTAYPVNFKLTSSNADGRRKTINIRAK